VKTTRLLAATTLALASLLAPTLAAVVPATAAQPDPNPVLVGIRASHHAPSGRPAFDRVVFDFTGGLPSSVRAHYVPQLIQDGSGRRMWIAGRAILGLRFFPTDAHDTSGATVPTRTAFALPNVMTAVKAGDFEAVTTLGLGLAKRTPFHVVRMHHPDRIVVDVRAAFRTVPRRVFFFDNDAFVANQEPFFRSVRRPVIPTAPARAVLDRLFAGPVAAERADGLRLLRSRATGLTGPDISGGVARTQMIGGCSSGGSTVTIAGEAMPTLRQFPSVRWVKIYGPRGHTERPSGRSDSIPFCLEP
jgi:hypothetical protein